MMTVMFGLGSLVAVFALGFVLGRVWEIRQDLRAKAQTQSGRSTRVAVGAQLNNRFWTGTRD
jgi:cytochrome bd-type quinol oxidase subunit 2